MHRRSAFGAGRAAFWQRLSFVIRPSSKPNITRQRYIPTYKLKRVSSDSSEAVEESRKSAPTSAENPSSSNAHGDERLDDTITITERREVQGAVLGIEVVPVGSAEESVLARLEAVPTRRLTATSASS